MQWVIVMLHAVMAPNLLLLYEWPLLLVLEALPLWQVATASPPFLSFRLGITNNAMLPYRVYVV